MDTDDLLDEEEEYIPRHGVNYHKYNDDDRDLLLDDTIVLNSDMLDEEIKEIIKAEFTEDFADEFESDERDFEETKEKKIVKDNELEEEINIFEDELDNNVRKQRKKRKKKVRIIVFIILIILIGIMVYSAFKIFNWGMDNKKTGDVTKKIEDISVVEELEDSLDTELVSEEEDKDNPYWYYITFPLINVDITKLKEENSDTIGWINVNNTNINYPFVQTNNNDYYLTHSFDKSENEAGWLFLDYRNQGDFSNRNNIIYGHSRLNKTMFGSLSRVLKYDWQNNKDNHVIRISLENENTLWQIFSVYKIKTETYYITTNFINDSEYLEFLNTIKGRSLYDFNANLSADDKILTLSTCYSDTERTVVHARLIKRGSK